MNKDDNRYFHPDERDRTVPPDENYYQKGNAYADVDLDFNSKVRHEAADEIINHQNNNRGYAAESGADSYKNAPETRPPRVAQSAASGENSRGASRGKRKKSKKAAKTEKKLIAALIVILIVILLPALLVNSVLSRIIYDDRADSYVASSELYSEKGVKNILLLGVDARGESSDSTSRSDTMMLVSINSKDHSVKLTSFLRDSWLYIPCLGYEQRLNAACTYGGYQGVVDAIEYNYGIAIDGYVVTDFEMFRVMVDSIGGIEVEVTEAEAKEVTNHPSRYGDVTLASGKQTLTGEQALAYCRIRKIDTDWVRTERQRTVMQEIMSELLSSNPFTAFKTVFNVAPYIETNLSKAGVISAGLKAVLCISGGFETAACPFDGTWRYATISGASVISVDVDENKEQLKAFIYGS